MMDTESSIFIIIIHVNELKLQYLCAAAASTLPCLFVFVCISICVSISHTLL